MVAPMLISTVMSRHFSTFSQDISKISQDNIEYPSMIITHQANSRCNSRVDQINECWIKAEYVRDQRGFSKTYLVLHKGFAGEGELVRLSIFFTIEFVTKN